MKYLLSISALSILLCIVPAGGQNLDLLKDRGALRQAVVRMVDSTATTVVHDLRLVSSEGDTAMGRIRTPVPKHGVKYPVSFLVVGLETGKEVIKLIEGYDTVIVLGIDYPLRSALDFTGWKSITSAYEFRKAGFLTVRQLALCVDWLETLPYVDTSRLTMVAVSFGVFTAVPAAVIDQRVDQLAVVQAGGDLRTIVAANAERLGFPFPSWLAGWMGKTILGPFEPNDYIHRFAPRPLLLVSGESDTLFPHTSVQSLYERAKDPKEWIRHTSSHVAPDERELIKELTKIVGERLYGDSSRVLNKKNR